MDKTKRKFFFMVVVCVVIFCVVVDYLKTKQNKKYLKHIFTR